MIEEDTENNKAVKQKQFKKKYYLHKSAYIFTTCVCINRQY